MSWNYDNLNEEEAQKCRFSLMEDGDYEAIIDKVTVGRSSKGNDMATLELTVWDRNGEGHSVKDFLVSIKQMVWKQRHCAVSAGLEKEFMEGKFHPFMLQDKKVFVTIATQLGHKIPDDKLQGKPVGSMYPDKNVVTDYVECHKVNASNLDSKKDEFKDDDLIPF